MTIYKQTFKMAGMNTAAKSTHRSRAHDPEGRRADVLAAARRLFAAHGYDQTSIRAIAAEADVNPALVVTYFGGKEALFMEAIGQFRISQSELEGDVDGLGALLARVYMQRWEQMADDDPWPALVRSALTHEGSYTLLRTELEAQRSLPLAKVLGKTNEGRVRNAMVGCLIAGMIMERFMYALQPACSVPAARFEAALGACLQHAISGPLFASKRAAVVAS